MKPIVFAVFAALGWCGAAWSSGLWDGKNGFFWGLLTAVVFDASVSFVSGASKAAWDDLTKGNPSKSVLGKVLNVAFAAFAGFVGYNVLVLGWHHWWTGFWASILLGAPGMGVGVIVILISLMHCLLSILPKSVWGKYVKE